MERKDWSQNVGLMFSMSQVHIIFFFRLETYLTFMGVKGL